MKSNSSLVVESSPKGFVAVITPPRNPFVLALNTVGLIFLTLAAGFSLFALLSSGFKGLVALEWLLLLVVAVTGISGQGYVWLWNAYGKEVIDVSQTTLSIKRDILGRGKKEEYKLSETWGFKVRIEKVHPVNQWRTLWIGALGDSIVFTEHFMEHSLGCKLPEADASTLVAKIQEQQKA
jgi:hypothetical protein